MIEDISKRLPRLAKALLVAVPLIVLIASLQAFAFLRLSAPDFGRAKATLYDLMVERSERGLYRSIARQVEALRKSAPATAESAKALIAAWEGFSTHFAAAPREAIAEFREDLVPLRAAFGQESVSLEILDTELDRLADIYADDWRPLAQVTTDPPLYLWPTAPIVARLAGYRQAVAMNRALYLAQTGDIGTARVMMAGLNASAEDPKLRAATFYVLARLQFELFRTTLEAEYYLQSLAYLRQSLAADPGFELATRLLDYLLSLSQAETVPQSADGRPETPAEGEGAAVSAEKRIF